MGKRGLFGVLLGLTLAFALGLIPGMSLTAYAEETGTGRRFSAAAAGSVLAIHFVRHFERIAQFVGEAL